MLQIRNILFFNCLADLEDRSGRSVASAGGGR
jgi:hypothetical protein